MNEKELEQLLAQQKTATDSPALEERFQKKVRRSMNYTIYTRVTAVVLALAVLVCGLYFGTSKVMDLIFYDPGREQQFLEKDTRKGMEFNLLLEDTISTYFPGKSCFVLGEYEHNGFSRYDVDLLMADVFLPYALSGPATDHFSIAHSQLDTGHSTMAIHAMEFLDPSYPYSIDPHRANAIEPLEPIQEELQKLPPSAYLDVSISFADSLTADQTAALIEAHPEITFRWLALEGQNVSIYEFAAGGMFLDYMEREKFTEEAEARYPDYYLPQTITGESLENCLISRLQLLIDHPDFVSLMETQLGDQISMSMLQQRLANAQETWACYGMRLMATPEDIYALMEQLEITQIRINDVKVSMYQK